MTISDENGSYELSPDDWILFDELNHISHFSNPIFHKEFLLITDENHENPFPLYRRRQPVVAEQILHPFYAYSDTVCSHGEINDYLVQDIFSPNHQSIFKPNIFEQYFVESLDLNETERHTQSGSGPIESTEPNDEVIETAKVKRRYPQRSYRNQIRLMKQGDVKSGSQEEDNVVIADVFRRRQDTFCLGFPVQSPMTIWKFDSGQGGRCHGTRNDIAVFHSTGDFQGFFSSGELFQYFRHDSSPFLNRGPQDNQSAFEKICCLVSVCDVLAIKLSNPISAYCNPDIQYGNPGDYLVQAMFPPPLPIDNSTPPPSEVIGKLSQWIVSSDQFQKQFRTLNPTTSQDLRSRLRVTDHNSFCLTSLKEEDKDIGPLVARRVTSAPLPIDTSSFCGGVCTEDSSRDSGTMHGFQTNRRIAVNVFDQYNQNMKCWSGFLQRRSRFLRQWNKKFYELFPDRLVIYKESPSSSVNAAAAALTAAVAPQHSAAESSTFIDLKYCVVHSVIIDDKPVLYLGNAKSSDEGEVKSIPLEPYSVTSSSERWESRYQKLTRLYQSSPHHSTTTTIPFLSSPEATAERGSGSFTSSASVVKSIQNFSYSNANGIFLMATDIETHNFLVSLIKECILFCRRAMAFHAAAACEINKLLEVLCSVSPEEANRILLSSKDEHSGKLIIHEAASSSSEMLKLLLSLGEDTFEHSNPQSVGSNASLIRSSVLESGLPTFLFLSPTMTCTKGLNCLHYAVLSDNLETVKYLLETELFHMNVDCQTVQGHTPLHFAKSSTITSYLLRKGANPTALDYEGRSPLMMMASLGNTAALTRLLRDVPMETLDINRQSWKTGYTALVLACLLLGGLGFHPTSALSHGLVNASTSSGAVGPNLSHFSQTATLIGLLLYYGADPNILDTQSNNCLHHIASIYRAGCSDSSSDSHRKQYITQQISTCVQMVKLLVQYGCSKFAMNSKGHIPLSIVCQAKRYSGEGQGQGQGQGGVGGGVEDILEPLIYGKQIHNLTTTGSTCTTSSALQTTSDSTTASCSVNITPRLDLSSACPSNTSSSSVPSPFPTLSNDQMDGLTDEQIISSLLKFRTPDGFSCIHYASHVGNSQILSYLLSKGGADPNMKDKQGYTPLDIIQNKLRKGGVSIVEKQARDLEESRKILIQYGASSRLRSDLPVEQDTEHIKFIRNPTGGYSVKSATIEEIIHRLCCEPTYCAEDAKAISLCYHHLCSDVEFLQFIIQELKILIHFDAKNSSSTSSRPTSSQKAFSSLSPPPSPRPTTSSAQLINSPGILLNNQDVFDFSQATQETTTTVTASRESLLPTHRPILQSEPSLDISSMKIVVRSSSKVNESTNTAAMSDSSDEEGDSDSDEDDIYTSHGLENLPLGGLFSLVMIWMNTCQDKIDYSPEFLKLLRSFTMLILRFCPDDISKPSLSLFESAVATEGKSDLLFSGFRNIAIDGNETINRHHKSTTQRNQVRESVDAYSLDGIIEQFESSAHSKAYKLLGNGIEIDSKGTAHTHLLSIKPIVFIQQMTIIQHHLYKKIPTSEMLSKKYTDVDRCPHLDLMRRWNTAVTNYLLNEILRCPTVTSRAEVFKFLLTCGFIAMETMNNFDLVVLIQGVLERTPIYRLKQSWERLEKMLPNKRAEFKKTVGICGKNVGTLMNKSEPPMIPYLGTIMQWIMNNHEIPSVILTPAASASDPSSSAAAASPSSTAVLSALSAPVDSSAEDIESPSPPQYRHLNISKHRHLAMIIQTFEVGQKIPYTIDLDLKVLKSILQPIQWNDEESMQARSVELEPVIKQI